MASSGEEARGELLKKEAWVERRGGLAFVSRSMDDGRRKGEEEEGKEGKRVVVVMEGGGRRLKVFIGKGGGD